MSNVGNYSISVKSFFGNWKAKSDKSIELDKKKKNLKPIINPIFEQCANLTDDSFWVSTFMDCARGKLPRGFTFKNNLITHRKGSKMTRLELSDNASEAFISTIDFFQKMGGIMSFQDREKLKKIEEEKLLDRLSYKEDITWRDVKTEKMKEILITEFIDNLSQKMNFDDDEKKDLTTTIKIGFILKYFTNANIEMENGKIIEIDGLVFNESKNQYEINPDYQKRITRTYNGLGIERDNNKPEIDFLEIWEKYLTNLENKRIKKKSSYSSSYSKTRESDELTQSNISSTI